jgi:glycerophosphoryl diester phosphodiesterase
VHSGSRGLAQNGAGACVGETLVGRRRCPGVPLQIVAHRGVTADAAENTLEAFRAAQSLGADAIELDVRLSADGIAVVYHYAYLEALTDGSGPIWQRRLAELRGLCVGGRAGTRIPTLEEVLQEFAPTPLQIEIELKGPEPETVEVVGRLLETVRAAWPRVEVTSYEPALLAALAVRCRGLSTALLFPRSEAWMGLDVVAHLAVHRARQAAAGAVHLHPTQLGDDVVSCIRASGIAVHAWDVNTIADLELAVAFGLPMVCTDHPEQALRWRASRPGRF